MSEKFQILCLYIALSLSFCMSQEQGYSRCNEGKDSCRDCYAELVRAVLENDDNIFSLNKAFFPPRTNPAEFVAVTYHFQNESMDKSFVWFWTEQSSYLLHPLHTFQFLSLFFGKPEAYYTQEADVTLNATDCWGADDTHLELLTHRLKAYVQKQKIFPSIDNTYSAKAVNHDELSEILQSQGNRITAIIVSLPFVMIVIIIFILLIVMCVSIHSRKWPKTMQKLATLNVYLKQKQAVIICVALISYLLIAYILALDLAALGYRENPPKSIISTIHFRSGGGNPFTLLYEIPTIVTVLDVVFGVFFPFYLIFIRSCCIDEENNWYNPFFWLCLSTLGFVFCIITRLPFIAIAYLNNAYHAGSIFIYYTTIILILFAVVEQMIVSCLSKLMPFKKVIKLQESEWKFNSGKLRVKSQNKDSEVALSLVKGECNVIKVSQGKVELNNKRVESDIMLRVTSGELKFMPVPKQKYSCSCKKLAEQEDQEQQSAQPPDHEFLTGLSQASEREPQELILMQRPLPKARVKLQNDETVQIFSGLRPAKNQTLKVDRCTKDTQGDTFTVILSETDLKLEKIGTFREESFFCGSKRCGYSHDYNDAWISGITVAIAFLVTLVFGIVAVLTCYFVIIPINRSISDAPNRLIGIYESAIVLIGAYIAYKAFFKAKKYLESSVVKRENPLTDPLSQESKDKWKEMSDEEKLAQFYSAVVDIIVDKKSKCQV